MASVDKNTPSKASVKESAKEAADVQLLYHVIRGSEDGKVNWNNIATSMGLPTGSAASKRYSRLMKKLDDAEAGKKATTTTTPKTTTTTSKAAATTPKTASTKKTGGRKKKLEVDSDEDGMEDTPTKKAGGHKKKLQEDTDEEDMQPTPTKKAKTGKQAVMTAGSTTEEEGGTKTEDSGANGDVDDSVSP